MILLTYTVSEKIEEGFRYEIGKYQPIICYKPVRGRFYKIRKNALKEARRITEIRAEQVRQGTGQAVEIEELRTMPILFQETKRIE